MDVIYLGAVDEPDAKTDLFISISVLLPSKHLLIASICW
jgi:hypothetical protein